jgi:hypothetical protein
MEPAGEGRATREPRWPRVALRTGDQAFFLRRLRRLTALSRYCAEELPTDDPEMRLLRHAIYSTYRDCVAAGVTVDAREILAQSRSAAAFSASDAPTA